MEDEIEQEHEDLFKPQSFYFFFENEMRFSQRKDWDANGEVDCADFIQMRNINRRKLTAFLQSLRVKKSVEQDIGLEAGDLGEIVPAGNQEAFSDLEIDQAFLKLLAHFKFGKHLTHETSGHLEFFMNTLNQEHKVNTTNAFENSEMFPALQYTDQESLDDANSLIE